MLKRRDWDEASKPELYDPPTTTAAEACAMSTLGERRDTHRERERSVKSKLLHQHQHHHITYLVVVSQLRPFLSLSAQEVCRPCVPLRLREKS
jgi:hypothetical protein